MEGEVFLYLFLLLIFAAIFYWIFMAIKNSNRQESFINVTNPFANGLSQFQLGTTIAPESQVLQIPPQELKRYDVTNNIKTKNRKQKKTITETKLNPYFVSSKFSDNYRDVMTALNDVCPNQKTLFNIQSLPVTTTVYNPNKEYPLEVYKIVVQFITQLNDTIQKLPDSYEILNDYNNYLPMTSQQTKYIKNKGINKFYNEIGVDFNLYADTPQNAPVELIKILQVKQERTEAETKYVITMVIHKILKSVEEQMKITVHFIIKNDILEGENLFRKVQDVNTTKPVAVEYIFINGFFISNFNTKYEEYGKDNNCNDFQNSNPSNFYEYDMLNENKMLSDNYIQTQLNKKYREHALEMNNFNINNPYPVYDLKDAKTPKWV